MNLGRLGQPARLRLRPRAWFQANGLSHTSLGQRFQANGLSHTSLGQRPRFMADTSASAESAIHRW